MTMRRLTARSGGMVTGQLKKAMKLRSEDQETEYNPQHLVNAEDEESIEEPPVEHRTEEVVTEFQEAQLFEKNSVETVEEYHSMASSSDTGLQEELSGHDVDSISEHKPDEIVFEACRFTGFHGPV